MAYICTMTSSSSQNCLIQQQSLSESPVKLIVLRNSSTEVVCTYFLKLLYHVLLVLFLGPVQHSGLQAPMATACYNFFPNCSARESAFFIMFRRDLINKLNMMLHAARRYFHDDNGLPNLEALKNIYQVVTKQLLSSRERYIKKHYNQQPSESQLQAGDLVLIKNHTAKSFEPKYKGNYRIVKIHGNNMDIRDYRGNISMIHITDMKKTTLTEQVADDYEELGKQGKFSKNVFQEVTYPTLTGQQCMKTWTNPSGQ